MASIIFTHHATQRLQERKISEQSVLRTVQEPDEKKRGKEHGSTEYIRRFGTQTITAIAKLTERGELLVVSAWIDPPNTGTTDEKKRAWYIRYKKASFWGKVGMQLLRIFGL